MGYKASTIWCNLVIPAEKIDKAEELAGASDGIRDWLAEIGFETELEDSTGDIRIEWGVTYHGEEADLFKIQECLKPGTKAIWLGEDDLIWKCYVAEVVCEGGVEARLVDEELCPEDF